jgi:glycerophosphoryl diester phosphodiesterase
MRLACLLAASVLALAACGGESDPTATASTEAVQPAAADPDEMVVRMMLPDRLDCLRASGGVLIVGHRGGPTRDYPENAIETFQRTFDAGTRAMEIDVQVTKDGQLILMHDEELDRTTTGTGLVADHTLVDIQKLYLETFSKVTEFHAPTLAAALEWAVKTGAIVKIDKKRETPYEPIIAAIRGAKAENNAIVITYTDAQAVEVHGMASELVIGATIRSAAQLEELVSRGVYADRLVAWTETDAPKPELWKALAAKGVEADFGTLGPRASSLDTRYWEDDDGSEYNDLVTGGVTLVSTDITDKVARQLAPLRAKAASCGL